jgi:hypothetical protein
MAKLTSREIAQYHEQGHPIPSFRSSPSRTGQLRIALEQLLRGQNGTGRNDLRVGH